MKIKSDKTARGFALKEFEDFYNVKCSIQKSSLATEDAIWFGCDEANPRILVHATGWRPYPLPDGVLMDTRMHLTREQVKELLPILQKFVETGEI